jgi:hypothetical protein
MSGATIGTRLRPLKEDVWSGCIEIWKDNEYGFRIQREEGNPQVGIRVKQIIQDFVKELNGQ